MSELKDALGGVLVAITGFGSEYSAWEMVIVWSATALVALGILNLCSRGAGMPAVSWILDLGALGIVTGVALVAEALSILYLLPLCRTPDAALTARIAAPVLCVLALGTPVAAWVLRGNYGKTLVSLVCTLVAAWMTIAGTNTLLGSVRGGFNGMNTIRDHKNTESVQLQAMVRS